jgi:hypothetical protein
MEELREALTLPPDVDLSEEASADLVARLASQIAPGLERSVGPVHWKVGDTVGVDWTAEGFVDRALVVVCLRPSSREVSLLVHPRFTDPSEPAPKSTNAILLGILGASVALGVTRRSVWWAVLVFIGAIAIWISVDSVRSELRIRRAIATLDRAGWRRRFLDAVAIASSSR